MKRPALWPPLVWLAVFLGAPTLVIAAYSFFTLDDVGRLRPSFSLDAWREVLTPDTLLLLWRSLRIAVLSTALCLVLAYPAAYFIAGCAPRWRTALLVLLILPFWTNYLARNAALKLVFFNTVPGLVGSEAGVVTGLVYSYLPFMVLPLYLSIEKVQKRLLEAASDLGAGPWRRFRAVTLPLTAPGIAAGCLLVFVPCFGAFVTPAVLGGAQVEMLAMQIDRKVPGNIPEASAYGLVMTAAILGLLSLYYRLRRTEAVI